MLHTSFRAIITASVLLSIMAVPARQAAASGQGIHLMTASKAVTHLHKGGLKNLLKNKTYKRYYLSGAIFPDAYDTGGDLFHQSKFLTGYAKHVVEECIKKSGSHCNKLKAHFLGVLTHQRTDNRFDRYFVHKVKSECGFKTVMYSAQFWTDEHLDQIAVCDHWDFGKTYGLTFIENVVYPASGVSAAAGNAGKTVDMNTLRSKISTQEARLKEEFKLKHNQTGTYMGITATLTPPDFCHKYLDGQKNPSTGEKAPVECKKMENTNCKDSYYAQCDWGANKNHYYNDQSVKGSVNDMGIDIIPGWIQTTYDRLNSAISAKKPENSPTFSQKGSGMSRDLCRNWIPASAKYCK